MSNTPLTNTAPVTNPIPGTQTPAPTGATIEAQARAIFPWWPEQLLTLLVDSWVASGDVNQALAAVRKDARYEQYFPGNKRGDGTVALSEQDYYATVLGYRNTLREYGLDPTEFEARGLFGQAISGELSVNEVARRLSATWQSLESGIPELRAWYAEKYGLQLTDQAIFAASLDTSIGEDILQRRLTSAQIGGLAVGFGFARDRADAERLAGMGVDANRARELYGRAQAELPTLGRLADRWRDVDPTVDIDEFEDALVGGDFRQQQRFERLVRTEQTSFTGGPGVRRTQEGGLIGLRER